ncbi:MAG: hypothetical protein H6621_06745 [Halobacteriovoraceae bacterium]|nr:hypothetical protein [Halobacteriovoraceae bacterium]
MLQENDNKKKNIYLVMGLAMGVPSTIIGVFFLFYFLDQQKILDLKYGILILVVTILNTFFVMVKYASKKD